MTSDVVFRRAEERYDPPAMCHRGADRVPKRVDGQPWNVRQPHSASIRHSCEWRRNCSAGRQCRHGARPPSVAAALVNASVSAGDKSRVRAPSIARAAGATTRHLRSSLGATAGQAAVGSP